MWRYLHLRQAHGHRFCRQVPIGPYVADFVCLKALIVIEVDGGQHAEARAYDAARDEFMRHQGFRILRFGNNEVLENMEGIWEVIVSELKDETLCRVTPHPDLPPQGGKGSLS